MNDSRKQKKPFPPMDDPPEWRQKYNWLSAWQSALEREADHVWFAKHREVLKRIVSGGQTGVDRAALDAALRVGFPCGGWCPAGRIDEEGLIPECYPVKPLKKGGYHQRTLQNIIDSDGTLIFYNSCPEGGTEETLFRCIKQRKPYKLIDFSEIEVPRAIRLVHDFVIKHDISTLNIAGPRASKLGGGAREYVLAVTTGLIRHARWDKDGTTVAQP